MSSLVLYGVHYYGTLTLYSLQCNYTNSIRENEDIVIILISEVAG